MPFNSKTTKIDIVAKVLAANDRIADENRRRFAEAGIVVVDVMGSPGSGKTSLIEATATHSGIDVRIGVIVGDVATARDAWRISLHGIPAIQIVTESFGGACHLEASTVAEALGRLDLEEIDLLFIENVGNLVCPAEFDLGQDARVVVFSIPEGEDKPLKYPLAFQVSDLAVISKIDLAPHLETDMEALDQNVRQVNPRLGRIEVSVRSGQGVDDWIAWLRNLRSKKR